MIIVFVIKVLKLVLLVVVEKFFDSEVFVFVNDEFFLWLFLFCEWLECLNKFVSMFKFLDFESDVFFVFVLVFCCLDLCDFFCWVDLIWL